MDAPDSAVARVDERLAVVDAEVVAAMLVSGDGGGSTGEAPGRLEVGVGANVTRGLVRWAGVFDDSVGPLLLRRAETRSRSDPERESPNKEVTSSSSANGSRRFIQIKVCH